MMRTRTHHILFLTALLHLFADVAFAGGVVLCVGPNDHREFEQSHLAGASCEAVTASDDSASSLPNDCSDSELHSDAEIASASENDSIPAPALVALPSPFQAAVPPRATSWLPFARAPDLAPALLRHRTTVLLL